MPGKTQEQRIIEVRNGADGKGVATGNNAAWLCDCGYELPLVGTSFSSIGRRPVMCEKCAKEYMVEGNNQRVDCVREISPEG
ncbi:MAG: hypothetical protein OXU31_05555 [Gammaproteobacteria bacterium]|nr:hypothetical protein [Gammaproteobacteria bacterium]